LRLELRLSRLSIVLSHGSRLHRRLLELRLRHQIWRQRLSILHRRLRRRRILVGHWSRLLVDRLGLLHRLILVLDGRLLLRLLLRLRHRGRSGHRRLMDRPRGRCTSLSLERTPRHRWARGSGVRERRLRLHRLHRLHRLRLELRLSRLSIVLSHGSRLHRRLLELRLRHQIRRQRLSILHRRLRRILVGHWSRLLVDGLGLLHRLILVLDGRLLLRLLLRLPIDRLRLRHRLGMILAVAVHVDFGIVQ
jgi:hypothetical protein